MHIELKEKHLVKGNYRIAYWDIWKKKYIAYPIWICWYYRLVNRIWQWSLTYRPTVMENILIQWKTDYEDQLGYRAEATKQKQLRERMRIDIEELKMKADLYDEIAREYDVSSIQKTG